MTKSHKNKNIYLIFFAEKDILCDSLIFLIFENPTLLRIIWVLSMHIENRTTVRLDRRLGMMTSFTRQFSNDWFYVVL